MSYLTPSGMKDFIPKDTEILNAMSKTIRRVLEGYQFSHVITPTLEYYRTLINGVDPALRDHLIMVMDGQGNQLALRPDHTTPIARMVATTMKSSQFPVRLYYLDSVFRSGISTGETTAEIETVQAGVEWIGENTGDVDGRLLQVCIDVLRALEIPEFCIDIGHAEFVGKLTDLERSALAKGDYIAYGQIPRSEPTPPPIVDLVNTHQYLVENNLNQWIRYNPGLVRNMDYYTGVFFEIYVKGHGKPVGAGGRYDQLLPKFGLNKPAIGFALNLNAMMDVVK